MGWVPSACECTAPSQPRPVPLKLACKLGGEAAGRVPSPNMARRGTFLLLACAVVVMQHCLVSAGHVGGSQEDARGGEEAASDGGTVGAVEVTPVGAVIDGDGGSEGATGAQPGPVTSSRSDDSEGTELLLDTAKNITRTSRTRLLQLGMCPFDTWQVRAPRPSARPTCPSRSTRAAEATAIEYLSVAQLGGTLGPSSAHARCGPASRNTPGLWRSQPRRVAGPAVRHRRPVPASMAAHSRPPPIHPTGRRRGVPARGWGRTGGTRLLCRVA